jgi:RNA polymerase sigma-70 factor (ECF subfamily)
MSATTVSEKSLDEVIRDLKNGRNRTGSFRWIFDHYYSTVCRQFKRNGIRPEDCLDLAQEVFLAMYNSICDLEDAAHFRSWMFSISQNTLRNEIKRRRAKKRFGPQSLMTRRSENDESPALETLPDRAAADILTTIAERQRLAGLIETVRALPAQMRRCVELRLIEGRSYREIASAMEISINTVKAHLHQAKKVLKEKLTAPSHAQKPKENR